MPTFFRYLSIVLLAVVGCSALALSQAPLNNADYFIDEPWLTGPLLAPSGVTIPKGHTNIEPYLFITDNYGTYGNNWRVHKMSSTETISPTLVLTRGLAKRLDFQASIPYDFNAKNNETYDSFSDIHLLFGIQAILSDNWPDLRITLGEIFPTGHYNNLNANRVALDTTGAGSYQTTIGFNFQKAFRIFCGRFLRARFNAIYTIPTEVKVNGFNAYGGGFGTSGTITPGSRLGFDLGFEFTLTQKWVPAFDVTYTHGGPTNFSGIPGTTATGAIASNGGESSDVITLAPAIEYNITPHLGVIGGAWFTVAGKDTTDFTSAVFAVNYYI